MFTATAATPSTNSPIAKRLITSTPRVLGSAAAGTVVMFGLAGLFNLVLAKDFIAEHIDPVMLRPQGNLAITFAGFGFLALLMAFAYRRLVPTVASPLRSGVQLGLFTAVAWLMPYTLVLFSVYRFPWVSLPLDWTWALVEQGLAGVTIALIQGRRHGVGQVSERNTVRV